MCVGDVCVGDPMMCVWGSHDVCASYEVYTRSTLPVCACVMCVMCMCECMCDVCAVFSPVDSTHQN